MKTHLLKLFLLSLLIIPTASFADEITIGNGNTTSYDVPFNTFYEHSWNEIIYPGNVFNRACDITSISFHCASTQGAPVSPNAMRIYMGVTDRTTHANNTDWQPEEDLTLVYESNSVTLGSVTGWHEFVLDQSFSYPGSGNLVVVVAKTASSYNQGIVYTCSQSQGAAMYRQHVSNQSFWNHPNGETAFEIKDLIANIKMNVTYEAIANAGIVSGTVSSEGSPLEGVEVTFTNSDATFQFTTSADGSYSGEISAGTYQASASKVGYNTTEYSGNVTINANATTSGINFEMSPVVIEVVAAQVNNNVRIEWSWDMVYAPMTSFKHFNVYRTSCDDATGNSAELLATGINDVVYIDETWSDVEPGSYKWGVSYTYEDDRESSIAWNSETSATQAMRGTTAYGISVADAVNRGYISFDIDNLNNINVIEGSSNYYAGEYCNGYYYLARTGNPQTLCKVNPQTGAVVASNTIGQGMLVSEMAYDYSTGNMYVYAISQSQGIVLGTIDLITATVSVICSLDNQLRGLVCTMDGQLYGITRSSGMLISINKNTGATNVICTISPMAPDHPSSACIDHNTGYMYMVSSESSGNSYMYKINLEDYTAVNLGSFIEIVGMYIPYTEPAPTVESEVVWSNCLQKGNTTIYCEAPEDLTAEPTNNGVTLNWSASSRALHHYNIYRGTNVSNLEVIAEVSSATTYFDELSDMGTFYYQVTAVYEEDGEQCESSPANSAQNPNVNYVVVEITSVSEDATTTTRIYPNPTQGELNIYAPNMTRVMVVNATGQIVYNSNVSSSEYVLNLSHLDNGIYMVSVISEGSTSTHRINIVR